MKIKNSVREKKFTSEKRNKKKLKAFNKYFAVICVLLNCHCFSHSHREREERKIIMYKKLKRKRSSCVYKKEAKKIAVE